MEKLNNRQYEKLIVEEVLRPYQGLIYIDPTRIERLIFNKKVKSGEFDYCALIFLVDTEPGWWACVIDRLSRCYSEIDFSFFPNEAFAQTLMKALIKKGVTPIIKYNDIIYANTQL